jgi:hypothetical protein
MPLKYDVEIEISGRDHDDRAAPVAYLAKLLTGSDENVIVQRADPEIGEMMVLSTEALHDQLEGKTVFIREIMHD